MEVANTNFLKFRPFLTNTFSQYGSAKDDSQGRTFTRFISDKAETHIYNTELFHGYTPPQHWTREFHEDTPFEGVNFKAIPLQTPSGYKYAIVPNDSVVKKYTPENIHFNSVAIVDNEKEAINLAKQLYKY